MFAKAIEVLKLFEENGHQAYIIGGYVRDRLLNIKSNDIDICTSATPKQIIEIFDIATAESDQYGAVKIIYKNAQFDVTTFRKELKYEDNRKPVKIKYIKDIKRDLLRRDFTINTLCINSNDEVLDFLKVQEDINKKVIKTVANPRYKLKEDSLRILRAIRFSTILDFKIDDKTKYYIIKYGKNLQTLSYQRKKDELNKIFLSTNRDKGRELLIDLKLDKHLELNKLNEINMCSDVIGIWAQLEVDDKYPFTKLEKSQMKNIRNLLKEKEIDKYNIYKYELYTSGVCAEIKGLNKSEITQIYNELPIYNKKEISIRDIEIANLLEKEPGPYLKDIVEDIEKNIIYGNVENEKEKLMEYLISKYK